MGSSGSRLGGSRRPPSRPDNHRPRFKRVLSSLFICGALSSSHTSQQIEDDPAEKLVNSAEHNDVDRIQIAAKSSSFSIGIGSECPDPTTETGVGPQRSILLGESSSTEDIPRNSEMIDKGKRFSRNKEMVFISRSPLHRRSDDASTSYADERSPHNDSENARVTTDAPNRGNNVTTGNVPQNCAGFMLSPSSDGLGESSSDELSVEICANELMLFHDCDSGSASVCSESPMNDTSQQTIPSSLGFLVTERDQSQLEGSVLQVDVTGASSNISSSSSAELSNHETTHNSRRLFWDAFSRRRSRRNAESGSRLLIADEPVGLESRDRWLLDFNGDFFNDGIGGNSRLYQSNNQNTNERRWQSSSEVWERFRDVGRNGTDRRAATCPAGIHADGACSCGSMLRVEDSGARASISRIVMLAEALFEVLDEIHRQPMSLSLSMVSLPAPESVVDSLPVKNHKKPERSESGDDVAQCYICLAEYEEGDKIRVLPCRHEYHVACVDKWLKEIHGVCPLCRGDVREDLSSTEGAITTSVVPSL